MPNPRFLAIHGEPTVELLGKMQKAKEVYFNNLESFCKKNYFDLEGMGEISGVYLIGSHAQVEGWLDDTSDVDLKLLMPFAMPSQLHEYKRKILDPILCSSERKRDWIDLYFAREKYQITLPRWNLTEFWNKLKLD